MLPHCGCGNGDGSGSGIWLGSGAFTVVPRSFLRPKILRERARPPPPLPPPSLLVLCFPEVLLNVAVVADVPGRKSRDHVEAVVCVETAVSGRRPFGSSVMYFGL